MRDENQPHAAVVELVAWATPRSNTPRCKTGTQAMKMARAASTTLQQSEGRRPRAKISGLRSKPALRSPGSTLAWCSARVRRRVLFRRADEQSSQADTGTKTIHMHTSTIVSGVSAFLAAAKTVTEAWYAFRYRAQRPNFLSATCR